MEIIYYTLTNKKLRSGFSEQNKKIQHLKLLKEQRKTQVEFIYSNHLLYFMVRLKNRMYSTVNR